MSLYMQWPIRNFYIFNHLVNSYKNTISEWAVGFRYENFTLKLARGYKSLASCGLIFVGEEISIPETQPIFLSESPLNLLPSLTTIFSIICRRKEN